MTFPADGAVALPARRVTVVIVSWNTCELLEACLRSLFLDTPDIRVVVVDNASPDDTVKRLAPRFPQVDWRPQTRNLGFAAGNNLALGEVETPYAWLLNPDTEVRPGAVAALVAWLDAHPDVAAAGAALLNPDGTPQPCSFAFPSVTSVLVDWLLLPQPLARLRDRCFGLLPRREAGPTDWVLGAAMMVRREALQELGLLNERFFMYAEELHWCRRAWRAGWQVHLVLGAQVMHHGGGGTRKVREPMLKELFRSRGFELSLASPGVSEWPLRLGLAVGATWNSLYSALRPQLGWPRGLPRTLAHACLVGWRAGTVQRSFAGHTRAIAPAPPRQTLSAVLITRNEGVKLADCLWSLRAAPVVGEIIVVDDVSEDDTCAVARRFTPHVLVHPHEGENFDLNKNVGMAQASGDWVLLIDADEQLTPAGAQALWDLLAGEPACQAYWLPRQEWYFGTWARHASSDSRSLRLFRRGVACFEGDRLHAHPRIVGEVGFVDAPLVHHAYDTVGEYIAKTRAYTDHEARVRVADGERRRLRDVWLAALRHVWYRGWKLGGYRDGWVGMRYVLVTALYPVWETWKIWRQQPRRRM